MILPIQNGSIKIYTYYKILITQQIQELLVKQQQEILLNLLLIIGLENQNK